MIYDNWQKFIRDDVKLVDVVMPGSHNAGSYGMKATGCCQDGNIFTQYLHGIRHFCIRLDTPVFSKKIHLSHGISMGRELAEALSDLRKIIEEYDDFFILDIREYYPQRLFGKFYLRFRADDAKVNAMLEEYIAPSRNALYGFDDITQVTMGDIRRSKKRFLLYNYNKAYDYSVNCPFNSVWERNIYGNFAHNFVKNAPKLLADAPEDGLTLFQLQQTPNLKTEIGFKYPRTLDNALKPHFQTLIDAIANDARLLAKANILAGDFMAVDYAKSKAILSLNVNKNNVTEGKEEEYLNGLMEEE